MALSGNNLSSMPPRAARSHLNIQKTCSGRKALEGKYLIQSEEPNLSPIEAVDIYKDLSELERAFPEDVIEMRPIYHRTMPRVEAHIFITSLPFLLDRVLEKKLKAAGNDLSSKEAWQALKTVRVVDIDLGDGEHKQSVTQGAAEPQPS